ncbi:MAG: DEAD/DEAH box helicase, partial [Coriobacteriales bacterium]|nr:DEAD/DEAH box helicase [Coriobacteriales bacterium]
ADRMLDMGFWPDVSKIIEAVPNERQTLLFSATLDDSVMKTIGKSVRDPKHVEIARKGTTAETITQYVVPIAQNQKNEFLEALLDEKGAERVIIFTRTKSRAEVLAERLNSEGFSAEAIHGDRSQAQRSRALRNFREGNVGVIVATDVLARGIDVSDVDHVINYDVPTDPEDYIHRIGRTGRAGEEGYAVTLLTKSEIFDFACIEHLMKRTVAELEFENFDFNENRPELDPNRDPNKLPRKGGKGKERSGKNEKSGRKREDRERTREHGEGAFREGDRSGRIERQGSKHNAGQGNKLRTKKIEARVERVAANSAILEGEQVPSRAKRRAESFSNEAKRQERIERRQKPAKAKPVKEKPAKANHPGKKDKPAAKKAESAGTKAAETKTSAERRSAYARKPQTKPAQQETSRKRRPGDRGGKR